MRVSVLGQLTVTDADGNPLPAGELPRRARQVLAVLAARHDRIQSKDSLADSVWGTDLPGNHVAALEHYVSVIRRRLQPQGSAATWFIVTRSGGYLFDTSRADLDLARLRRLVRELDAYGPDCPEQLAAQESILALARQLPFPEDPYAEWAEPVRTEVQAAAVNALLKHAAAVLSQDAARSLRLAHEVMELNPFLESGYRAAMIAAIALDRQDDALRIFERCRQLLDEELGVAPSAELVRLQRSVLASRGPAAEPGPPPAPVVPRLTVVRPEPPRERFLGRLTELRVLIEPDPPPVVHIVGPAGSGKSAFLAELERHQPGRVGIGHGASSVGVLRHAWLGTALAQLDVSPEVLAVIDAAGPEQPLRRSELELVASAFAGPEPAFVAVDDAADLDAASVAELSWLSRHCPSLRIVLTYCYPSQIADRPLSGLGTPVVLRLEPLHEQDLTVLGDNTVLERTGGIPALVAVARRPAEVTHAVAMQIARQRTRWMPEPAWEILRLCAILGELGPAELSTLTGYSLPELLSCVDRLVHAHLLTETGDGRAGHRSSLIRAAVAGQVSTASALYLRKQLAAAS
ncbi:AfsR/SARP family transcriptional regulator [Actinoplanes aureus]|uniref:Winged helix-turn-helix domain-containing protein n=1 Tax=Actinoplanes aureus TaxID=2792083 RepID=A0A931FWN9_9ACTN|nr:BTAD domain-containing putative transcriptional regulator [Actinoplanes aureus]MBG0561972.1 winged helix-turn-helix domain-containing protein [Actinoplanes aureus]